MISEIIFFLNTHGVVILITCVILYLWFAKKAKSLALHALFSVIVTGGIVLILKELFSVPRPFENTSLEPLAGYVFLDAFPSMHTALAFSLSTAVALRKKNLGIFLFVLSFLIGIGRVAANVHYPVDIAYGAILGSMTSLFTDKIHFSRC